MLARVDARGFLTPDPKDLLQSAGLAYAQALVELHAAEARLALSYSTGNAAAQARARRTMEAVTAVVDNRWEELSRRAADVAREGTP